MTLKDDFWGNNLFEPTTPEALSTALSICSTAESHQLITDNTDVFERARFSEYPQIIEHLKLSQDQAEGLNQGEPARLDRLEQLRRVAAINEKTSSLSMNQK